ncbi:MAG TPA: hypothetical protein G4O14_00995 [Anaerolineae bacterium]|nr:hypothetical protein [Anaerolineae bacterium]
MSSVLAGFAITVAIELIALAKKGPLASSAIAVFLTSSIITVVATFIFVFVMTSAIGPPGSPKPSDAWIMHFLGGIGVLPFLGLILFLAGIGLVGWLHSKPLGIITTVSAALAVVLIIYILRSIVTMQ